MGRIGKTFVTRLRAHYLSCLGRTNHHNNHIIVKISHLIIIFNSFHTTVFFTIICVVQAVFFFFVIFFFFSNSFSNLKKKKFNSGPIRIYTYGFFFKYVHIIKYYVMGLISGLNCIGHHVTRAHCFFNLAHNRVFLGSLSDFGYLWDRIYTVVHRNAA